MGLYSPCSAPSHETWENHCRGSHLASDPRKARMNTWILLITNVYSVMHVKYRLKHAHIHKVNLLSLVLYSKWLKILKNKTSILIPRCTSVDLAGVSLDGDSVVIPELGCTASIISSSASVKSSSSSSSGPSTWCPAWFEAAPSGGESELWAQFVVSGPVRWMRGEAVWGELGGALGGRSGREGDGEATGEPGALLLWSSARSARTCGLLERFWLPPRT